MGYGFFGRGLGLEDVPGIKPRPNAHASPSAHACADDRSTHDPGTDSHTTVPACADAVWKLLELV